MHACMRVRLPQPKWGWGRRVHVNLLVSWRLTVHMYDVFHRLHIAHLPGVLWFCVVLPLLVQYANKTGIRGGGGGGYN